MDFDENHCDACGSPTDDHRCKGCESGISFRDHLDSEDCTGYCDGCAQNRMVALEAMLDNAVFAIDAWSNTCAPLLSPQAIIDAATFVDEARALLKDRK